MKTISATLFILFSAQFVRAQNFPWQPDQVILGEKDTFILVERIEFDAENRLIWLTQYAYDDAGIKTLKTELDGEKYAFYSEESIAQEDNNSQQKTYKKYVQKHQDSLKRLESLSCYDDKNRLLWKLTYNHSGEVIDSLVSTYDDNGILTENSWRSSLNWSGSERIEEISRMLIYYSDSGKFITTSYITKKHHKNGMESKSSSTTTYQFDLSGNQIEERHYWNDRTSFRPMYREQSALPKRELDDTLQKIISRTYDENNRLIHARHSTSLDAAPFLQEFCEYDQQGRLVKSYQLNEEGVETDITFIKYGKRKKNTVITSTKKANNYLAMDKSVSLVDDQGRFLRSARFYEGEQISADEWSYQLIGDVYQVELKEFGEASSPYFKLTRWTYKRK